MANSIRVQLDRQEANGARAASAAPGLTQEQKEATIQKWASWILKQREVSLKSKPSEDDGE
jgi:hypothetical protein